MPIYKWRDNKSLKEVEVVRKFDDYTKEPEREEANKLTDEEFNSATWERIVSTGIKVTRSIGYGTKGHW